jgi:hypothetical protein
MASTMDYHKLLQKALDKALSLTVQREEINAEILKLRQFIYATMNMLPEKERSLFQDEIAALASQMGGLTDSIRETLKLATQRQTFFSAVDVRDHLVKAGFDFSQYSSNPLASVNTALRRFKPSEVETVTDDDTTVYRWIIRSPRLDADEERRRKVAAGRLGPSKR